MTWLARLGDLCQKSGNMEKCACQTLNAKTDREDEDGSIPEVLTLADRHRAMGSDLDDGRGTGTAWPCDKDQEAAYMAIRSNAGFMDVSALHKAHLVGPHAGHDIDSATTRNTEKIKPGRSSYTAPPLTA